MVLSPLNKSNNVTLLKSISTSDLAEAWRINFGIDILDEFKDHKSVYLYECNQTKLKFFYPSEISGSAKLYEKLQQREDYYLADKWEYQVAIKDLSDYNCKNILEIGCGVGYFIGKCHKNGLTTKGIEINANSAKIARSKGFSVDLKQLNTLAIEDPYSFDAICSFQVLEHITNPKDFIGQSIQLLKPEGLLIFAVPNSEGFLKYQDHLLDLPPHHMLRWSIKSFKALEDIFPIKLEKVRLEPLSELNVPLYLNSIYGHYRHLYPPTKLFLNHKTKKLYEILLNCGLRKYIKGHSLYVLFQKK